MSKYKNKKTVYDGFTFDSIKEMHRYKELKLLEKAGCITSLERQKKYVLIPAQREPNKVGKRGGVIKGKLLERETAYIADFAYFDIKANKYTVEDVKSAYTRNNSLYRVKKKLMLYVHNIQVKEV